MPELPEAAELERVAAGAARAAATRVTDHTGSDAGKLARELLTEATPRASLQWMIDSLERPFGPVSLTPILAVSIAAAVEGEVVAGAVVDVLRAETFSAHLGGGARRDGRPIEVSSSLDLAGARVATARGSRSPALELCRLACGRLDGYFARGIEVAAYAAGALIAEEAGATAELPCPENGDLVIAATPGIFAALRTAVGLPGA